MTRRLTPAFWIRTAAVVALLFAFGHTSGAPWTPTDIAAANAVVNGMREVHFETMGTDATYWNFYYGFGLTITCYLLALAAITWQIGTMAKVQPRRVTVPVLTLAALYASIGVLSWMYFFAAPFVLSVITVLCLLSACWSMTEQHGELTQAVSAR